jgi:hypothetical protein
MKEKETQERLVDEERVREDERIKEEDRLVREVEEWYFRESFLLK